MPFKASVETPSGPSFGECRVSRQPARKPSLRKTPSKRLRNMPRIPKVKPKDPFEICLMSLKPCRDSPRENPESPRVRREPSECEPPEASECATCRAQDFHPD